VCKVAILIPYFNPVGYRSHLRKLFRALQAFRRVGIADDVYLTGAGVPRPSGVNIAFWDEECPYIWHKERLLNLGARRLPSHYTHVVWADSDVIVGPDWAPAVARAFALAPVIQCFQTAYYRSTDGRASRVRVSSLRAGDNGAIGLCWGADRSLFSDGPGLFELALVGGGDAVFAREALPSTPMPSVPWLSDRQSVLTSACPGPLIVAMDEWQEEVCTWIGGAGAVAAEADIEVLGHGPENKRRYTDRHALLADLEPGRHLVVERDRVFRWSADGLALVEPGVRAYFHARSEDDEPAEARCVPQRPEDRCREG
jgi:hypothetical protein